MSSTVTTADRETVMITGAAGHLGKAVAAAFRQRGANLVLIDRGADALQVAFGEENGALAVAADLLDRERTHAAVQQALARFGRIDTLCHLAGGFHMGQAVHETSPESWDFLLDINARTLMNVAAAVVPHMVERGGGRIVTVGAAAAARGTARMGAYSASKSALIRLTESMSDELKDSNINVNCVLPSIIDTADNRSAMPDADSSRWVGADALADVIAFLGSDAARAIHGSAIPVMGRV
jgi:NAD(P)-dependent dehydrogenase (short-subunit alcohol dehydrogenase family)